MTGCSRQARRFGAATLALFVLLAASCGGEDPGGPTTIRILAASSLTDAFTTIGQAFEATAAGAGVDVEMVFAGSSSLATQVDEGVPADAVATADELTMDRIVASGRVVGKPVLFARNSMVIAVHADAAERISTLADLAADDVVVALCAEQVPCGRLARRVLEANGVDLQPDTAEANVRGVLTKVLLGEVDAGLVYRSDVAVLWGGEIKVIELDATDPTLTNPYPLARLAANSAVEAFVDFVVSPEGLKILADSGFEVDGR